ncbi:MAG TPA: transglutaminase domain-containing protein [Bacteroidales bacterium]|nr:transglutaminase domain-containing protein [Bacteroidales bacterium]
MKLIFVLSFLCLFTASYSQYKEPKFGKIDIKDLEMSKYDRDTSAGALILFDNGYSRFVLSNNLGFQYKYERHFQIKIFKKSAFDLANISLRLFQNGRSREEILGLKAVTYNLVNGKTVKTKLENNKIFHTDGKNYTTLKFAFPEVKEGSIIELSYDIVSDFLYDFRGWNFQYAYPARWSMYTYEIPEYFSYREYFKGYLPFDLNNRENKTTAYTIQTRTTSDSWTKPDKIKPETISVKTEKTSLGIKDVPPFISEPGIDCDYNYIQSMEFELSSIQFPNQAPQSYTQTWQSVNEQLRDEDSFGGLLKNNGFLKDTVNAICAGKSKDTEKAMAIYDYVRNYMEWNGNYSMWVPDNLKKPFRERVGNSAEINMLLTLMLKTAGLKAQPVVFSTRDNGYAQDYYPTISKFNSVMAEVEADGKAFLLDAINKNYPFGVLPVNDINGKGRIVNETTGSWIDLNANDKYTEDKTYDLCFDPEGNLTGTIIESYGGYAGMLKRNALDKEKNIDDYFRKMQENTNGLTIDKYETGNRDIKEDPFTDSLSVKIANKAEVIGDRILFYPLLLERIEKNRFTLEDRKYPVNFNYPISEVYHFSYTIPEGYSVESLPGPATINLPDNSISISYSIKNNGNRINVDYKRDIQKMIFLPTEYPQLKALYDQMVKKQSEQVILKKNI